MKGLTTMYEHKWKKIGMIVSGAGLILMAAERVGGFIFFRKLSAPQHYSVFEWVMLLGLVTIMYSKELMDDDRVKLVRLKSLQLAFGIMVAVLISAGLVTSLHPAEKIEPAMLYALGAVGILMYLFLFHIGIYFDFLWEYDDPSVTKNIRNLGNNKWALLVYLLVSAVSVLLLNIF